MATAMPQTTHIVTTIIVCPTPAGGHIEHACDLAIATQNATGHRAKVLTRPGALDYLSEAVTARVDIREVIPPLVVRTENASRLRHGVRLWKQFEYLLKEHWRIRAEVRSVEGVRVLVLEEPRYPVARLLKGRQGVTKICLILHNAVEHAVSDASTVSRLKAFIASQARRSVDYIAVHGDRQRDLVESTVTIPVRSFPLPGNSYVNNLSIYTIDDDHKFPALRNAFVCLGEIRENKGIEIAVEAAKQTGMPLLIIGKAIDPSYLKTVVESIGGSRNIQIHAQFVSAGEFEFILSGCRAILLPYTQFDAQSGVLSRASQKNVNVVASDLPSLREQASGLDNVQFFEKESPSSLAQVMREIAVQESDAIEVSDEKTFVSIPEWDNLAVAIQSGW